MLDDTELEQTLVNDSGTAGAFGTRLTQAGSLDVLRRKHGATSPIGYRCSNLIELMQMPELPQALYDRQMADLKQQEGVDQTKALAAIRAVLGSFEPSHEHKEAACAFMLAEWFSKSDQKEKA